MWESQIGQARRAGPWLVLCVSRTVSDGRQAGSLIPMLPWAPQFVKERPNIESSWGVLGQSFLQIHCGLPVPTTNIHRGAVKELALVRTGNRKQLKLQGGTLWQSLLRVV